MEIEDYKVNLRNVLALELTIDADLGKNQTFAALAQCSPKRNPENRPLQRTARRRRLGYNSGVET
jgi:hypothetical protein